MHIIEDFHAFGKNFAYEVIGGMLQLDNMHEHKYKENDNFNRALSRRKELRLVLEGGQEDEQVEADSEPAPVEREERIYGPFIPR